MARNDMLNEIDRKRQELRDAEARLDVADRQCGHEWGPTINASIYHEAYTCPGDPPGTMGVDWRGPVHVPSRTEQRWKRVCKKCGKEEFTSRANETSVVVATPVF